MSYLTLKQFGFTKNPFAQASATLQSLDLENVCVAMQMAGDERGILSIVGPRGAGKSSSVASALPPNAQIVQPLTADRERMRIGAIEDAIILDLSSDKPRRSAEARTRQVRPILGDAGKRGPVYLLLEESHRLHHQTLRALKSLHELKWAGRGPLLTIVLIGQRDPLAVPALEEVALRTKTVRLAGLSEEEARTYIANTVGRVWDDAAAQALAGDQAARNYLDFQEAIIASMDQALAEGRKRVELSDVYHATGAGLRGMIEAAGLTQAEVAKAIGKDKSTVNRVVNGERADPNVRKSIQALLDQKAEEAGLKEKQEAPQKRAVGGA